MLVIAGGAWVLLSVLSGLALLCIAYFDGSLSEPDPSAEETAPVVIAANAEVSMLPILSSDDPLAA
jgi:hypothetical protein